MKRIMQVLLAAALVLTAAAGASAQSAGDWHHVHGQVQSVQGSHFTLKTDDGRMMNVDMSQVSQSVQSAMAPNLGVTVTGFPGTTPRRFTARYIEQDSGPAPSASPVTGSDAINRVATLVPDFVNSPEFQSRKAGFRNDRVAARRFVDQLYRGFFDRSPREEERASWVDRLLQGGDVQGTVIGFLQSPEYMSKNKNDRQVITDLYEGVLGRTPSHDEVTAWQRQIARR